MDGAQVWAERVVIIGKSYENPRYNIPLAMPMFIDEQ